MKKRKAMLVVSALLCLGGKLQALPSDNDPNSDPSGNATACVDRADGEGCFLAGMRTGNFAETEATSWLRTPADSTEKLFPSVMGADKLIEGLGWADTDHAASAQFFIDGCTLEYARSCWALGMMQELNSDAFTRKQGPKAALQTHTQACKVGEVRSCIAASRLTTLPKLEDPDASARFNRRALALGWVPGLGVRLAIERRHAQVKGSEMHVISTSDLRVPHKGAAPSSRVDAPIPTASEGMGASVVVSGSHSQTPAAMVMMPDGRHLASIGAGGDVILWDLQSGLAQWRRGQTGEGRTLAASPDGEHVLAVTESEVVMWSSDGQRKTTGLDLHDLRGIQSVVFSADGKHLAGFGHVRNVVLGVQTWRTDTLEVTSTRKWETYDPTPGTLVADPHRERFLYADKDVIHAMGFDGWPSTEAKLPLFFNAHRLAVSPDGNWLAVGDWNYERSSVRVYDLPEMKQVNELPVPGGVNSLAFSPDSTELGAGITVSEPKSAFDDVGRLFLWRRSGSRFELSHDIAAHGESVSAVVFDSSGHAISTGSDLAYSVWDTNTGREVKRWGADLQPVRRLSFDGEHSVMAGFTTRARRWNLESGVVDAAEPHVGNPILTEVAVSPDGLLAAGTKGDQVVVYTRHGGEVVFETESDQGPFVQLTFHPNGRELVGLGINGAFVWDVEQKKQLHMLPVAEYPWSVLDKVPNIRGRHADLAIDPTGSWMVISDGSIYDAKTWKRFTYLDNHNFWVNSVAISRDKMVVFGGGNQSNLVNLTTFESRTLVGHDGYAADMVFSEDGTRLIMVHTDGSVQIRDGHDGRVIHSSMLDESAISVATDPDNRYVAVGTAGAGLNLFDLQSGAFITRTYVSGETDFATLTADSFYMASRGILDQMSFRIEGRAYPFEQFDLYYNRPDKVLEALGLAEPATIETYHRAYLKRLAKMGIDEASLTGDFHLPTLRITNSDLPTATADPTLSLSVKGEDAKYPLARLHVYVNGVPVDGEAGRPIGGTTFTDNVEVALGAGENRIQVSVRNDRGVESLRELVTVEYSEDADKRRLLAVVIGVSDYAGTDFDLTYAAKDARDLGRALKGAKDHFDSVQVVELTDGQVTRKALAKAKEMLATGSVDDVAMVFVAGHGLLDDDLNYWFGASEVDFAAPANGGIPYSDIEGLLSDIPPRQKLLLMDTCFSGEVDEDEGVAMPTLAEGTVSSRGLSVVQKDRPAAGRTVTLARMKELFADLRRGSGAVVIASAGGREYAFESEDWRNGVFTYSVLDALSGVSADTNYNERVSVRELQKFVTARVRELTNGQQNPTTRQDNLSADFDLY